MTTETAKDKEPRDAVTTAGGIPQGRRDGIVQVAIVAGVLAAGVIANFVLSRGSSEPQVRVSGADAIVVDLIQPQVRDTPIRIVETGTLQVRSAIELSPQVSGRVMSVVGRRNNSKYQLQREWKTAQNSYSEYYQ